MTRRHESLALFAIPSRGTGGNWAYYLSVPPEFFSSITADDIAAATKAGYSIKLIAICERLSDEDGYEHMKHLLRTNHDTRTRRLFL